MWISGTRAFQPEGRRQSKCKGPVAWADLESRNNSEVRVDEEEGVCWGWGMLGMVGGAQGRRTLETLKRT